MSSTFWGLLAMRLRASEERRARGSQALASRSAESPIRVVYLDHVAQLSGGEIALLRLVPHLVEVEPHFILAENGPFAEELDRAGISNEVLPMAERARDLRKGSVAPRTIAPGVVFATASYILRLALRLRHLRPDLVHTNSLKAGVYGSIAARLAGAKVVWHVRDRIATDYLPRTSVRVLRIMTRRLAAAVIANSHTTMSTLNPRRQSPVAYAVVPEALIVPAVREVRQREEPLTVGLIGRLAPWKGQDLFLRAFADAFPDNDARCLLVGAAMFGESDYEQQLRELVQELGLGERVEFRGFRSDVWSELAHMHILVHASLIPEPFGQVILEGMAARVPVIAANAGGPAEIIDHDVNGVLYQMGDQSALAETMRRLAADPKRRERLIDPGLAAVGAYHPDKVAAHIEQLYRDLLKEPPNVVRKAPAWPFVPARRKS